MLSVALGLACGAAQADGNDARTAAQPLPAYRQECGACHIAYPPALLPQASWQRLMSNLPRHFGTDASLDPATQRELAAWLQAHAARNGLRTTTPPPDDRITTSTWFRREHDEVPAATWKRMSVKSPSNCAACHRAADQGDFDEHQVRIPR
jgi:hypothetical protein